MSLIIENNLIILLYNECKRYRRFKAKSFLYGS